MNIDGYLAGRLAGSKGWTAYAPVSEEEIEAMVAELRTPPAEIDLFVELGLLDEAEAEVWRGRWAARENGYVPPPGARERAGAHLASIHRSDEKRYLAALITYEQLGLWEPQPDSNSCWESDEDHLGDDEESEAIAQRTMPGPDLTIAGVTVTEVGIYEDHAEVRWRFDGRAADASAHIKLHLLHSDYLDERDAVIRLADDVGTTYDDQGGGFSVGEHEVAGATRFEPAPPAAARVLNVVVDGAAIKVLLR